MVRDAVIKLQDMVWQAAEEVDCSAVAELHFSFFMLAARTVERVSWFLKWQCVKTNSTPVVHIKIAGIYGCSSH